MLEIVLLCKEGREKEKGDIFPNEFRNKGDLNVKKSSI